MREAPAAATAGAPKPRNASPTCTTGAHPSVLHSTGAPNRITTHRRSQAGWKGGETDHEGAAPSTKIAFCSHHSADTFVHSWNACGGGWCAHSCAGSTTATTKPRASTGTDDGITGGQ